MVDVRKSEITKNVLNMTLNEALEELKKHFDGCNELCGSDDEINTIPAKKNYARMIVIINSLVEIKSFEDKYRKEIDNVLTIEDCIKAFEQGKEVLINDGQVTISE